ncbi:MAG: hypothetical protein M1821_007864 [Bathelium mastoideum]|nr:MAG: hypothetical protein M1821_007864 [Bathelium mastoideum]
MAAVAGPQTPQRLPGGYMHTPATTRQQPASTQKPHIFRQTSALAPQRSLYNTSNQAGPVVASQQPAGPVSSTSIPQLSPIQRAQKTVNETLSQEARFLELDQYVTQGISSEYDIMGPNTAWAPFQKTATYDIPDTVLEQYNLAQMSTKMGLFPELGHVWITIDNAFYFWDYKSPNATISGYEGLSNNITAVKLVKPRANVFKPHIKYILVIATTVEIMILGVAPADGPEGASKFDLTETGMSMSIRGVPVSFIVTSSKNGRIFFGGDSSNEVYELLYQAQVGWFKSNVSKISHTTTGFKKIMPSISFGASAPQERIKQMVIDDSRNLLYTLSSQSNIRVFHIKTFNVLELVLGKSRSQITSNLTHMVPRNSDLLQPAQFEIASISPIPANEASRLTLQATTTTGCRIFFSATSGYSYYSQSQANPPTSMQVHHVKFPPPETPALRSPRPALMTAGGFSQQSSSLDVSSKALIKTHHAYRFCPGFNLCFYRLNLQAENDQLFVSAPESGRIALGKDSSQVTKYPELGVYLPLGGNVQDVGLLTPPFSAASTPPGFGNEMAVQFDQPVTEIAVLTSGGVHVLRRRRLVDIFATAIRNGGGDEGLDGQVKKFSALYGRSETMATALAVACGQGVDTSDLHVSTITDPDILEFARKIYVEFGTGARVNDIGMLDHSTLSVENVEPSSRHKGLSLYLERLTRSIWKAPVIRETVAPTGGLKFEPPLSITRLREIQKDVNKLSEFLGKNKSFIEGLSGPEALRHVTSRVEEVALQGEHQAMHSMSRLIENVIEGIAFVLVLFNERTDEVILSLPEAVRREAKALTFEALFCSPAGKDIAKELVKAIVNRNIAAGSNVDTIAEALRRSCGSFCSADDVVIFKAQEMLKRALEAGANSERGRASLNESLKLFQKVAGALTMEQMQSIIEQYINLEFFAGAIQLCLDVAKALDPSNRALAWIEQGCPDMDAKKDLYDGRTKYYELVHKVIVAVDQVSAHDPGYVDGQYTAIGRRKSEAYDVINESEDEVFQTNLYDWYLSQGWSERLLEIRSPFVVKYLERRSREERDKADLLWNYHARRREFWEAAQVQLHLAKSDFDLPLDSRIEYLARARANASTGMGGSVSKYGTPGLTRQELLREAGDLIDIADIQSDLVQALRSDSRLQGERRTAVLKDLEGKILDVDNLYNTYVDPAGYYDIALQAFVCANYRNKTDIASTWQNLINHEHSAAVADKNVQPWERVAETVRTIGRKLLRSEWVFSPSFLLPLLLRYSFEHQRGVGAPHWVLAIFLDLDISRETLFEILELQYYGDEAPFHGRNRRYIATEVVYLARIWFDETRRAPDGVCGGAESAQRVAELLRVVRQGGVLGEREDEECDVLRSELEAALR